MTTPSQKQHRAAHRLWHLAGVVDRAERLALTAAIVHRPLTTSSDLTSIEALEVVDYMQCLHDAGELHDRAAWWLDNFHRTSTDRKDVLL